MSDKNQKPSHLLVFKVVGFVGIGVAIVGFILLISGFQSVEPTPFMLGGFMTSMGMFTGFVGITFGFRPEIVKLSVRTAKYVQEENKEDLTDMADTGADIISDAVKKVASSVNDGMRKSKFCKHCGAEIDEDSRYCSRCGKEQ